MRDVGRLFASLLVAAAIAPSAAALPGFPPRGYEVRAALWPHDVWPRIDASRVDPRVRGTFTGRITRDPEGRVHLTFHATFQDLSGTPLGIHIRLGGPYQTGPALVNLCVHHARCLETVTLSDTAVHHLGRDPVYVEVVTERNPGGELRGPLEISPLG
jgi:hypothetical protein